MKKRRANKQVVHKPDLVTLNASVYDAAPQPVAHGSQVEGVYFDGYPQLVKAEGSIEAKYAIKKEKDVRVTLRAGNRISVDVYRPDVEGEKFPAILAWGFWGKDAQEAVAWNADKPQPYYHSPFWDGTMEAGDYTYTVPRGFAHVIPDPPGVGDSEGVPIVSHPTDAHNPQDIADTIEWIAAQPWCNGKVGMVGPSSYSIAQLMVGTNPPPNLTAIHPDEGIQLTSEHFHGIFDTLAYHIVFGRHGNDSTPPPPNQPQAYPGSKMVAALPPELLNQRLEEALEHPDIKYNTKWYSHLKYPMKHPQMFDLLLDSFHPMPIESNAHAIKLPMYIGAPWCTRLYLWGSVETFEKAATPKGQKKLILYPPGFPSRPHTSYHDETLRWYDYWLKGIDTGVLDEPPIKLFVMGVNKWRFENEWPLARTEWTKFYLQPGGGLSLERPEGTPRPESFTQPAPYLDPKVYCLKYRTEPFVEPMELTGPVALYLEAAIDADDTNWMVDLVDVDPKGKRQLLSSGYLKAKFRAVDEGKSRPFQPIHPRREPVPVTPGQVNEYAIAMMPTSNVFLKGHSMELVIRNQDDLLSRLGTWGVYMLPFMQTVKHDIHFGRSHLYLPLIPANRT